MSSMALTSDRIPATERREQILEAAAGVFGEQGYAGATTDRIARQAGIKIGRASCRERVYHPV